MNKSVDRQELEDDNSAARDDSELSELGLEEGSVAWLGYLTRCAVCITSLLRQKNSQPTVVQVFEEEEEEEEEEEDDYKLCSGRRRNIPSKCLSEDISDRESPETKGVQTEQGHPTWFRPLKRSPSL